MGGSDLTLCIVAKNEAKGLRRAVESAAPVKEENDFLHQELENLNN